MKSFSRRTYYLLFLFAQPLFIILSVLIGSAIRHTHEFVATDVIIGASIAQYLLLSYVLPLKKYSDITAVVLGFIISFINLYISHSLVFDELGERTFSLNTYSLQYAGWVEWLSKHIPGHPNGDAILICSFLVCMYLFSVADTEIVYKMIEKNNKEKVA